MKYLRSAMRRSRKEKPPSLYLETSSRESSPRCSTVLSDWDADDEGFMSSREFLPSRPLSVAIPTGPYCPRRPTLQEVLANSAPPPWTLSSFMAYLSQNHCLETLEFTMDASRYRKIYTTTFEDATARPFATSAQNREYVRMLWQKLLDAYITPSGPREVNLPSEVRDQLLRLPNVDLPPHPAHLDPAVKIIYELMDESVLVPFLNSMSAFRGPQSCSSPWASSENVDVLTGFHNRSTSPAQTRSRTDGSPPGTGSTMDMYSPQSAVSSRFSQQSHLAHALSRGRHTNLSTSSTASSSYEPMDAGLTDDSADSPSPTYSSLEPMTPPTTPPTSDADFGGSPGRSPRQSRGDGSGWKKMSAKLGWKKSRSGPGSSTSGSRYPLTREASNEDSNPL